MNWRKPIYLSYASLRGYRFPSFLSDYLREWERGCTRETVSTALSRLLSHCRNAVPYYADLLKKTGGRRGNEADPYQTLLRLPVLKKQTIRDSFERLQSTDLRNRKWSYNTSGGSTGEPVRLVQDSEYEDRSKAITMVFYSLLGHEIGQPLVWLWGADKDVEQGTQSPKACFFNWLTNTTWTSAYLMSRDRMRRYVATLNRV